MYINSSNLTAEEHYRLNGSIREEDLKVIFDAPLNQTKLSEALANISEARGQYPAEDFLEEHKNRLIELLKRLRGDNKETLKGIIESLDDLAMTTFYAADYGRRELDTATETLEALVKENA